MTKYLKFILALTPWCLLGCAGSLVLDIDYDLEVLALPSQPDKRATKLFVRDEPRATGAINPFPNKSFDHADIRVSVSVDSLNLEWKVFNHSAEPVQLGFDELSCLDLDNRERYKLNAKVFSVRDSGAKKARIFSVREGAQSVEILPGTTTYIGINASNMRTALVDCMKLQSGSVEIKGENDFVGKEILISLPYKKSEEAGKYSLRFKIKDTRSRTSYY